LDLETAHQSNISVSLSLAEYEAPCCSTLPETILFLFHIISNSSQPAQQVIRDHDKSVVFGGRGKHTEMTSITEGLLLPCIRALYMICA